MLKIERRGFATTKRSRGPLEVPYGDIIYENADGMALCLLNNISNEALANRGPRRGRLNYHPASIVTFWEMLMRHAGLF